MIWLCCQAKSLVVVQCLLHPACLELTFSNSFKISLIIIFFSLRFLCVDALFFRIIHFEEEMSKANPEPCNFAAIIHLWKCMYSWETSFLMGLQLPVNRTTHTCDLMKVHNSGTLQVLINASAKFRFKPKTQNQKQLVNYSRLNNIAYLFGHVPQLWSLRAEFIGPVQSGSPECRALCV